MVVGESISDDSSVESGAERKRCGGSCVGDRRGGSMCHEVPRQGRSAKRLVQLLVDSAHLLQADQVGARTRQLGKAPATCSAEPAAVTTEAIRMASWLVVKAG